MVFKFNLFGYLGVSHLPVNDRNEKLSDWLHPKKHESPVPGLDGDVPVPAV